MQLIQNLKRSRMRLKDKKILFGLTGSIAIYKSAGIIRHLIRGEGADITVIMTDSAKKFISPLLFETLTGNPVSSEMFESEAKGTVHIDLARGADLLVICPATANIIGKIANGIADNLLTTIAMVKGIDTLIAPAMNDRMYLNPVTQENMKKLRNLGYEIVESEEGELACKTCGIGRLADEDKILLAILRKLGKKKFLTGKKVVVTAGPTREYIDDIRFISNRSSGKMGFAIAEQAYIMGADVTLIAGPNNLKKIPFIEYIEVQTSQQMLKALLEMKDADYLFMAAAIEDFVPEKFNGKIKKSDSVRTVKISYAEDIIKAYKKNYPDTVVVGFSVETVNGKENTLKKLREKGIDYIAWNDPTKVDTAFESDYNEIVLYSKNGNKWDLLKDKKIDIARELIEIVAGEGR